MTSRQMSTRATVTLRLELGTETITGTLQPGDGAERPFWGWVELSNRLDDARRAKPALRVEPREPERWLR